VRALSAEFGNFGAGPPGVRAEVALGGPDFLNKQRKRAPAADAVLWAVRDALQPDDHAHGVLDPAGIPPACVGVPDEPLHMQRTFQGGTFGGFRRGEIPTGFDVVDEPALAANQGPQVRFRVVLRDYRRGSAYHVYHHAVIAAHGFVINAAGDYALTLWVPRKVMRCWNSRAMPADSDRMPENRRNVLVTGRLLARWYVQYTPPGAAAAAPVQFLHGPAGMLGLAVGRRTGVWVPAAAPGLYESVCEYQLQLEPHGGGHEWHAEHAMVDLLTQSTQVGGGVRRARLVGETPRVDAAGRVFLDGRSVLELGVVP
jgi:hypothetical protein